jgi:hypothetical protein
MPELYSYVIHHKGQPCVVDNKLVLSKCKPTLNSKKMVGIRYSAKEYDWVIATLGKNYDKKYFERRFFSKYGDNARFFLVYAMKVTDEPDKEKTREKPLKSIWFFMPKEPIILPKRYRKIVSLGRHHRHIIDDKLVRSLEAWIGKRMQRNSKSSEYEYPNNSCAKDAKIQTLIENM